MDANMRSVVAPQVRKHLDHGQNGNAQKLQPREKARHRARGGLLLLQAAKRKVTSDKLHSCTPLRLRARSPLLCTGCLRSRCGGLLIRTELTLPYCSPL
jgi:hypothetical protein